MKSQVVSATEFKAKCLGLLEEIGQNGGTITVTKRGRPIATVGPVPKRLRASSEGMLKGKVHIPEELLSADTDMSDLWECVREAEAGPLPRMKGRE
ncbi:MAG TPA: type II toxin-antitoxin system prevent-host-death family antitoxin [Candidatus Acidoferrales bacterium]|jgi:prevent-host-death family protein|nr:type II toxin-antitoxin system prevent-host-death family antitoxin [Candidatus Acidoferrales bacterium]